MAKTKILTSPKTADFLTFVQPASLTHEKLTISALVSLGKVALKRYHGFVTEAWFTDSVYKRIFRILMEMYEEDLEIEIPILSGRLKLLPGWQELEGDERTEVVIDNEIKLDNLEKYIEELGERYRLRCLQNVISDIWREVNHDITEDSDARSTSEIVNGMTAKIQDIANKGIIAKTKTLGAIAIEREEYRTEVAKLNQQYTGIRSGITKLDQMTLGFQTPDYITIAAAPSMGKTAVGLDFIRQAQIDNLESGFYIQTYEMSKEAITNRFLSKETGISVMRLRIPAFLTPTENAKLKQAREKFEAMHIYIDDAKINSNEMVMRWYRQADSKVGLKMIMADYIQLIAASEEHLYGDMKKAVRAITSKFRRAAGIIGVPFLNLSQVRREVDDRPNRRPGLRDCAESSNLENDSDVMIFIYRDYVYDKTSDERLCELIVAKQKDGPTGTVFCGWNPQCASIYNIDRTKQEDFTEEIADKIKQRMS